MTSALQHGSDRLSGVALWGLASPWALVLLMVAVLACAWAVISARRSAALHRTVAGMVGPERDANASSLQLLAVLGERWSGFDQRAKQTNPVTDLPTREQLLHRMTRDMASGQGEFSIGLLHFAEFDQLLAFDDVSARMALRRLGERITQAAGAQRFAVQVDRATFAVWLDADGARDAFGAIAYVGGQQIPLTESVLTPTLKCSLVDAAPHGGAEQVLAKAFAALQVANGAGPSASSSPVVEVGRERFRLEQELARAIGQDQLSMMFQPVIDAAAGRLIGAEALLRWRHPELGAVSPVKFIPIVERLGLSERYGLWVLNAACREAARWRAQGFTGLRMAVNLSARQVLDPDLETKIDRTLARHGLDSPALELELTETAAMADADRTFALFTRLRARGINLAIDDFGTGYSSLSYLKNLPFTKLKIDREFVTDIETRKSSQAICKALIELGRGLDLVVLAEGVETAAEVETLRRLGCSVFQGFHFSRPLDGEAFIAFLRRFNRPSPAAAQLSSELCS